MSLVQLHEHVKPINNLEREHQAIVVYNKDPKGMGRVKILIPGLIEAEDINDLPWAYPLSAAGGNGDGGSTATPPVKSFVTVKFPTKDIYYPQYVGSQLSAKNVSPLALQNPTPEAPSDELPYAVDPAESASHNLQVNAWSSPVSEEVSWIRIDKNQGTVELFLGDTGSVIRFDRGGNAQIRIKGNWDELIEGNCTRVVKGNLTQIVEGEASYSYKNVLHHKVTGMMSYSVEGPIGFKTDGTYGIEVAGGYAVQAAVINENTGTKYSTAEVGGNAVDAAVSVAEGRLAALQAKVASLRAEANMLKEHAQNLRKEVEDLSNKLNGNKFTF